MQASLLTENAIDNEGDQSARGALGLLNIGGRMTMLSELDPPKPPAGKTSSGKTGDNGGKPDR